MNESPYTLVRAIRFADAPDAMCVPIFARHDHNYLSAAACDVEQRILGFHPIFDFENYMVPIRCDFDIRYEFEAGDICPFVVISNNEIDVISESTLSLQISALASLSSGGPIYIELLDDLRGSAKIRQIQAAIDEFDLDYDDYDESELVPKQARLWLEESIREARVISDLSDANDRRAAHSLARLKLLSWAKEFGENSTSPIFRHFTDNVAVLEGAGVHVEDLYAVALIRRITENVPRGEGVRSLIARYRARYRNAPLNAAYSLANADVNEFSTRASIVVEDFFSFASDAFTNDNLDALLTIACATSSETQWPADLRDEIDRKIVSYGTRIHSLVMKIADQREAYDAAKERLDAEKKRYRPSSNKNLRAMKNATAEILNARRDLNDTIRIVDIFRKARSGVPDRYLNEMTSSIDYKSVGVNEDFIASLDTQIKFWAESGEIEKGILFWME